MVDWVTLIPPPLRARFFISYRSLEAKLAEAFENQLLVEQQEVWRDRRNIYSGDHWRSEIRTAIRDCDDVVVLLTPLAAASEQVIYEVETAVEFGKRLHCFSAINLRDVPRLSNVIDHINWEPVGSGSGAPSIDIPLQFASYAVGRILAPLHKSHPLDLRDFERCASRTIFPRFSDLQRGSKLDCDLIERYRSYANRLAADMARCNAMIALNAGLLSMLSEKQNQASEQFERSLRLNRSGLAMYYYAFSELQDLRPRHLSGRSLDKCILLATEAWKNRQSPLIGLLLVTLLWDSGRGRGDNLTQLFVETLRVLPSVETRRDEIARFLVMMPFAKGLHLPVPEHDLAVFLSQLARS